MNVKPFFTDRRLRHGRIQRRNGGRQAIALLLIRDTVLYSPLFTSTGGWTQQAKLVDPVEASKTFFGCAVDMSDDGNTEIIGSCSNPDIKQMISSVYIYIRENGACRKNSSGEMIPRLTSALAAPSPCPVTSTRSRVRPLFSGLTYPCPAPLCSCSNHRNSSAAAAGYSYGLTTGSSSQQANQVIYAPGSYTTT